MLENIKIDDIIFLDIETVPKTHNFKNLNVYEQELWEEKKGKHRTEEDTIENYYFNNAGIFAEFGRIICISVGWTAEDGMFQGFELRSFAGDEEKLLLKDFCAFLIKRASQNKSLVLSGHNIREFDVPYICRRLIMNDMKFPTILKICNPRNPGKQAC